MSSAAQELVIAGATAPEIVKLIEAIDRSGAARYRIRGFLDDDPQRQGQTFMGYPVLGGLDLIAQGLRECGVVNNVQRSPEVREVVWNKLRAAGATCFPTLAHPGVDCAHAEIGEGVIIYDGCVIGPGVRIGRNSLLSFRVVVAHESTLGETVVSSPGVILNGRVTVEDHAFLGAGCIVLPYRRIGESCRVGAGAVVIDDAPANSTVFGNPARVISQRKPGEK
jgi:acetyltransferase EpsM